MGCPRGCPVAPKQVGDGVPEPAAGAGRHAQPAEEARVEETGLGGVGRGERGQSGRPYRSLEQQAVPNGRGRSDEGAKHKRRARQRRGDAAGWTYEPDAGKIHTAARRHTV